MLKSIGPTLNQVSSLNSLVGVNTPLATSGALCGLKPKTAMKKIRPPSQRPPSISPSFLAWLIPASGSGAMRRRRRWRRDRAHRRRGSFGPPAYQTDHERHRVGAEDHERGGQPVRAATDDAGDDDRAGQQPDPSEGLNEADPDTAQGILDARRQAAIDDLESALQQPRIRTDGTPNAGAPRTSAMIPAITTNMTSRNWSAFTVTRSGEWAF